jgi:hypothetical protein
MTSNDNLSGAVIEVAAIAVVGGVGALWLIQRLVRDHRRIGNKMKQLEPAENVEIASLEKRT